MDDVCAESRTFCKFFQGVRELVRSGDIISERARFFALQKGLGTIALQKRCCPIVAGFVRGGKMRLAGAV